MDTRAKRPLAAKQNFDKSKYVRRIRIINTKKEVVLFKYPALLVLHENEFI